MNNGNPKSLSAKRAIFLILAIAIAVVADQYFKDISIDYNIKYFFNASEEGVFKVYSLVPILFYVKLFILLGALVFIGYSAGTIFQLLFSYAIYAAAAPIFFVAKYCYENGMDNAAELFKFYGLAMAVTFLITLTAYLVRKIIKTKRKTLEAVLHNIFIIIEVILFYSAYRLAIGYLYTEVFFSEANKRELALLAKDTAMLFPITFGIIIMFVIFSRVIFRREFSTVPVRKVELNDTMSMNDSKINANRYNNNINNSTVSNMPICSKCGSELIPDGKFCVKCGSVVELEKPKAQPEILHGKLCVKCSKPIGKDALFCIYCGAAAVKEENVEPVIEEEKIEESIEPRIEAQIDHAKEDRVEKDTEDIEQVIEPLNEEKLQEPQEKEENMTGEKFCINCGKSIENDSKFCRHCGAKN